MAGLIQQLHKEIELKKALEATLRIAQLSVSSSTIIDDKVEIISVPESIYIYLSCLIFNQL